MRQRFIANKAKPRAPRPMGTPKRPSTRNVAGPIKLSVGGTMTTDSGSFGFDGITEDSRCPTGVECFWEGQVVVSMWASPSRQRDPERFSLTLRGTGLGGQQDRATKTVQGKRFRLLKVEPYPTGERPIDPSRYVVTVQVERLAPGR
jgi:hypothetical protein